MRSFKEFRESRMSWLHDLDMYAKTSDAALDKKYGYGRSNVGTFGYEANKQSAYAALNLLSIGVNDIEELAAAVHEGWAKVAREYNDPIYATKPEKKINRMKLAATPYSSLSEDEKEKDRVVARAIMDEYKSRNHGIGRLRT